MCLSACGEISLCGHMFRADACETPPVIWLGAFLCRNTSGCLGGDPPLCGIFWQPSLFSIFKTKGCKLRKHLQVRKIPKISLDFTLRVVYVMTDSAR